MKKIAITPSGIEPGCHKTK